MREWFPKKSCCATLLVLRLFCHIIRQNVTGSAHKQSSSESRERRCPRGSFREWIKNIDLILPQSIFSFSRSGGAGNGKTRFRNVAKAIEQFYEAPRAHELEPARLFRPKTTRRIRAPHTRFGEQTA